MWLRLNMLKQIMCLMLQVGAQHESLLSVLTAKTHNQLAQRHFGDTILAVDNP